MQTVAPHGPRTVFIKTTKGHAEIAQRHHGLNPRQRRVLIIMDGTRSLDAITQMIPEQELQEILPYLAQENFIVTAEAGARHQAGQSQPLPGQAADEHSQPTAEVPAHTEPAGELASAAGPALTQDAAKLREIKDFMTITTHTYTGLLGASLIERIERARDAEELMAVVGHWHMALCESRQGSRFAQPYLDQVRKALQAD